MKAGHLLQNIVYGDGSLYSFLEFQLIVPNILFQCFPYNIWQNGVCCAQHVFYQIIKTGMYYRIPLLMFLLFSFLSFG